MRRARGWEVSRSRLVANVKSGGAAAQGSDRSSPVKDHGADMLFGISRIYYRSD